MKNRQKAAIASSVVLAAASAVLLWPRSLCACITPVMQFEETFGVDPLVASEGDLQAAVAGRWPVGTSAGVIEDELVWLDERPDGAGACARRGAGIECESELARSAFGAHRRSVRLTFELDPDGALVRATARSTRELFGAEL